MTPRILVLTPRFPYPLYGGDLLRIYQLCEALKGSFEITLLSICQTNEEMETQLPEDSPFAEVHRVFLPKWKSYASALLALIKGNSMQLAYYASREFSDAVLKLQDQHEILICHLARTAPYAMTFTGTRILELTDYIPLTYSRSNALKGKSLSMRRLIYTLEQSRVDKAQNQLARTFDLVTFVAEVDRMMFIKSSGLPTSKVATFGNGVSLQERPFDGHRTGKKIAFIGTLKAMPNSDAISHFIETVLPLILAREPDVRLKVIGAVDAKFAARFKERKEVEFTGSMPDLAQAMSDCVVGVCPVRIGAGVQNKMLDYMSLGLASVTTTIGAEGIDGAPGSEFLVADTPEEFSDAVLSLVRDAKLRLRLSLSSRLMIENTYSWEARLGNLSLRIKQIRRTSGGQSHA